MKKDIGELKKLVVELISSGSVSGSFRENNAQIIDRLYQEYNPGISVTSPAISIQPVSESKVQPHEELSEELLSLEEKEKEIIRRAIEKHRGKRTFRDV